MVFSAPCVLVCALPLLEVYLAVLSPYVLTAPCPPANPLERKNSNDISDLRPIIQTKKTQAVYLSPLKMSTSTMSLINCTTFTGHPPSVRHLPRYHPPLLHNPHPLAQTHSAPLPLRLGDSWEPISTPTIRDPSSPRPPPPPPNGAPSPPPPRSPPQRSALPPPPRNNGHALPIQPRPRIPQQPAHPCLRQWPDGSRVAIPMHTAGSGGEAWDEGVGTFPVPSGDSGRRVRGRGGAEEALLCATEGLGGGEWRIHRVERSG
jgi:hypothetical protein